MVRPAAAGPKAGTLGQGARAGQGAPAAGRSGIPSPPVVAAPADSPAMPPAARRAAAFAVLLVAIGATAVGLRVFHADLHPQLVLFLYSIPANSAVSVFSHEIALYDYGGHQPLLLTTLTATLGTIAAGYLDWNVFVPLLQWEKVSRIRGNRLYRWAIDRFERAPFATLVVAGFTPIPFFPFKFLAFSMRYPLPRYLAALAVARAPRYFLLAWMGKAYRVPEWILLVLFLALLAFGLSHRARARELLGWRKP